MGVIEIEGMKFYAYHGHFAAEQIVGNHFEVYLRLETNCDAAAQSDNLRRVSVKLLLPRNPRNRR